MQRTKHSFYKERKRTQKNARTFRSFEKNAKEGENIAFFWKERMPNPISLFVLILYSLLSYSKYKIKSFKWIVSRGWLTLDHFFILILFSLLSYSKYSIT